MTSGKNIHAAFPGGRFKALTLSYDDGNTADRRLVSLFNEHGLRGTFHLNGGLFGTGGRISASEVHSLYAGHEISAHTLTHPTLGRCPMVQVIREICDDRKVLEDLAGYPIRGMSYPNGSWNRQIMDVLPFLGIEYARVVPATGGFDLPGNFHEWMATCHHGQNLLGKTGEFLTAGESGRLMLMYVWGHSFEFDRDDNWNLISEFALRTGGRDDVWYATNIEIVDYVKRWKNLHFSADCSHITNPSAGDVWVTVNGRPVCISGGTSVTV